MHVLAQTTTTTSPDAGAAATAALAAMSGIGLIVALVVALFVLLIWFMIIKRTGMNPWLCLLMLVPIANFIVLIVLAFSEWPVQREVKALRAQLGGIGPGPTAPTYPPTYPPSTPTTLPPPGTPPATT